MRKDLMINTNKLKINKNYLLNQYDKKTIHVSILITVNHYSTNT
jgi:hypothetical protein